MRKRIEIFLEKLKFVGNYQRFLLIFCHGFYGFTRIILATEGTENAEVFRSACCSWQVLLSKPALS